MAKRAPGQSDSTAWAMTCAVECRRTSRPSSLSAVTMRTLRPVGQRGAEVDELAVDLDSDGRRGEAPADEQSEIRDRRAGGDAARGPVGKEDGDLGEHDHYPSGWRRRCRLLGIDQPTGPAAASRAAVPRA